MKAKQLREMSRDELNGTLDELEKRLFELRSQAVTEKLENSKAVSNARRDIARIKTVLHEAREKGVTRRNRGRRKLMETEGKTMTGVVVTQQR